MRAPDSLEIYAFEGEGAFELLESVENETIKTRFIMLKEERLSVCLKIVTPANDPMSERTFKISFINTQNGLAKVFVNGREVPAKTRHNRCIQAEVTLLRGSMAEIVVFREAEDDLERVKVELLKCAIRVPQENLKKEAWWSTLKQCASIEELGIQIEKLAIPEVWEGLMQERLHRQKKAHT